MTEPTSLRRAAQARYRALAQDDNASSREHDPHPGGCAADPPHKGEGGAAASGAGGVLSIASTIATPLTGEVRALYESSVVPVREIARLAGVTERTLYKYVQKGGWTRRYAKRNLKVDARSDAKPVPTFADRAQPRGAGGRFVPVEEDGKPVARGLKALDPDGARQAAEQCARAGALSDAAMAAAQVEAARLKAARDTQREAAERLRALDRLARALVAVVKELPAEGAEDSPALRLGGRLGHAIVVAMERCMRAPPRMTRPVPGDDGVAGPHID